MPTIYLLDTNHITAIVKNNASMLSRMASVSPPDRLTTSVIVEGEWEYGILNALQPAYQTRLRTRGNNALASLQSIYNITSPIALNYGLLYSDLKTRRQLIPTNDIWIAATAMTLGAILLTTDKHFQRLPQIQTDDWTL